MLQLSWYPQQSNPHQANKFIHITLDTTGIVQAFSPGGASYLGYSVAELIGQSIVDLFVLDDRDRLQQELAIALRQSNHEPEQSFRLMRRDADIVTIRLAIQCLHGLDDRVTVLLTCKELPPHVEVIAPPDAAHPLANPVALRQAEIALQKSQTHLELALKVAHLGFWELDLVTHQITYSAQLRPLLGLPSETTHSTYEAFLELVHPDDRSNVQTSLELALTQKLPYANEFRVVWADGSLCWIGNQGQIDYDEMGNPTRVVGVAMDITLRKHAEEELCQSHSFLKATLDHLPLAVFVKDGRADYFGKFRFWNKTCELMFGLTAEQAIDRTVYDYFPQEQADFFCQKDREAFASGRREDIPEEPIDSYSLGHRLLHTIKIPIYDENGNPQYLLCISEDITERKQAEAALQQQIEREQIVAAIAQHIRQSLNLEQVLATTVAEVRHFLQTDRVLILRFEPDWNGTVMVESVGSPWKSLLGDVIADPCFTDACAHLYRQGQTKAVSNIHTHGLPPCYAAMLASYQVQASLVVPILQGDRLWGLLIAHHCCEPRDWQSFEVELLKHLSSQASTAIQQSELYQQVQHLNADLERQVQTRTAQLQLAFDFEATLKRITDRVRDSLDEDNILQSAVQELAIATGVSGCNAALYDLEQRTSTVRYEYTASLVPLRGRVVQMDNFSEGYDQLLQGQYFQFCSLLPHPRRGRVVMFACPILDNQGVLGDLWLISSSEHVFSEQDIRLVQQVTNQCAIALRQARLYQQAQAQVEALEALNRLKDDFLSTVSHELRTPMANIKLAAQMLEIVVRRAGLVESGAIDRYLKILNDECQREISLINDLLDLSRLEADSDPVSLTTMALQEWIPQIASSFATRIYNQQQQLHLVVPSELPKIRTDLSYLERIVTELLNNACKYTPAFGHITVTASVETDHFRLQISNSGVEILANDLTRVFEKFYRIPNNDPWKYGGTGLGLALVKKLVETLGGTIHVTSNSGLTCFTVELPIAPVSLGTFNQI